MNRSQVAENIRLKLKNGVPSVGSWIQIPHSSVAEIIGNAGYDWVAVDMEHGSISLHQLPNIFRALELNQVLPLVRLAHGHPKDCKQALDAGAGGVIVPMVKSAEHLKEMRDACRWPPSGIRGVGFSRANLFGEKFLEYADEAQKPILVAQIEHISAVEKLDTILDVEGLDSVFIGPYDLSASMKLTGQFENSEFKRVLNKIIKICREKNIPLGIHVVQPNPKELKQRIKEGYQFIAYSIDSDFLNKACKFKSSL